MTIQSELYRCFGKRSIVARKILLINTIIEYSTSMSVILPIVLKRISRGYQTYEAVWNGWVKYGKEHERLREKWMVEGLEYLGRE